ncbi:hypothetical protein Ddc_21003 [Ditylenchus destructor]|nr:hypothetical protein Ddc_21003 [Ditylenchus destructor]
MYPVLSAVLSITTGCFKKRPPVQQMDRKPQPNVPPLRFQFGLIYNILSCFDRRELCHLRNVNRQHYTVIERKFGITPPYLVFDEQYLCKPMFSWKWGNPYEKIPSDVRVQLPTSKFVRFKSSELLVHNPSESNIDVLSISHLWENQKLTLNCASNFVWSEEWANMAAKAKYLELEVEGLIPYLRKAKYLEILDGQGSLSYLRQLTSGNCVRLSLTNWTVTLDTVFHPKIPWQHILDFLFKPNPKDTKCFEFRTHNPFNHYEVEIIQFLQQVKQKFLDSLDSVHFSFALESFPNDNTFTFDGPGFDDFIVQNRRTQQRLRFRSTVQEFRLAVEDE